MARMEDLKTPYEDPSRLEAYYRHLAETGRVMESARKAGLKYASLRTYINAHEDAIDREAEAHQEYNEGIERDIDLRARQGADLETVTETGVVVKHKGKPSDSLLLALAKRRMAEYKEKSGVDVNVAEGGVIVVQGEPITDPKAWAKAHENDETPE